MSWITSVPFVREELAKKTLPWPSGQPLIKFGKVSLVSLLLFLVLFWPLGCSSEQSTSSSQDEYWREPLVQPYNMPEIEVPPHPWGYGPMPQPFNPTIDLPRGR